MSQTIKKVVDIIHELFKIGKTTAKDLQISGDVATAKRIKNAILARDIKKIRKIVGRGGILVDGEDIMGVWYDPPGVTVSIDFIVNYRQMVKIIRRYKREEG